MSHYILELALWLLGAYFIGCFLGAFARSLSPATVVSQPLVAAAPVVAPVAEVPAAPAKSVRPTGIQGPREGTADDLQRISGVGPALERTLHGLGFYHFDQIANWSPAEIAWVNEHLNFPGRIEREEWVEQARLLAAGDEATFSKLYGTGGEKDSSGRTRSGTRTRRDPGSAEE
ncbi:MAG: hypothetical protein U1E46_09425 [Hyphomicrobiales bacterium]